MTTTGQVTSSTENYKPINKDSAILSEFSTPFNSDKMRKGNHSYREILHSSSLLTEKFNPKSYVDDIIESQVK